MIETYIKQRFTNLVVFNEELLHKYPYHTFIKHLDLNNKKILHTFNGLMNKKVVYEMRVLNLPIDYPCEKIYFYQTLSDNYYIEFLWSSFSCLSVFSFIKDENEKLKKFYLQRWNFSVLPSVKYILRKLEQDPEFLAPLITSSLTNFYEFYKRFHATVSNLQKSLRRF